MRRFTDWHKRYMAWFQDKLGISDYGMLWLIFLKGLLLGLLLAAFYLFA